MIDRLLEGLTAAQKKELDGLGISRMRRSDWKHGRRTPTAAQLMVLAMVTNTDPQPLLRWLAEQEATPAQLDLFRRVKESGTWAFLTLVLTVAATAHDSSFAQCSSGQTQNNQRSDGIHIVNNVRRLMRKLLNLLTGRASGLFFDQARPITTAC